MYHCAVFASFFSKEITKYSCYIKQNQNNIRTKESIVGIHDWHEEMPLRCGDKDFLHCLFRCVNMISVGHATTCLL